MLKIHFTRILLVVTSNNARGSFNFSGQFTARTPGQGIGNAVADLLLGLTSQASITTRQLGAFLAASATLIAGSIRRLLPSRRPSPTAIRGAT